MAKFTSSQIRNVCLVGHSGDGKTSLVESMLYLAKAIDRLGKPSDGNTASDFDPEEIKRGYSIQTSLVNVEWNGKKINILDTPGMFDFAGEVKEAVAVSASSVIVVDAKSGCKVGTELAWDYSAGTESGLHRQIRSRTDGGRIAIAKRLCRCEVELRTFPCEHKNIPGA